MNRYRDMEAGLQARLSVPLLVAATLVGRAGLAPGAGVPKTSTVALASPEQTRLGEQFAGAARRTPG